MQKESFCVNKADPLVVKDINTSDYLPKSGANRYFVIRECMVYVSPDCGNVELLAPASVNSYKEAINGGANAIYFGYGEFNARAGGDNFTNLKEIVDYCHFHGVLAYLALNIAIKDDELERVTEIIIEAERCKIDAFIISDLALVSIIRKHSQVPIHASTQMGVHNVWGVRFLEDMGIERAVLSREMTLENIKEVIRRAKIETECFVHGALCVGFSGGCLLSSMLTGNSGNRGRCNQLCRQYYKCKFNGKQVDEGYLLSAKDNCMSADIYDLKKIGVKSLKIEGRLKRPEYVGGVTRYYRDKISTKRSPITDEHIKTLFNRGDFTDGYFTNKNVIYQRQPNHIGIYVGKVTTVVDKYTAYVATNMPLYEKNGYKILRNHKDIGGAVATGKSFNGFGQIKANFPLKPGDVLRLTSDKQLADAISASQIREPVDIKIKMHANQKPLFTLTMMGREHLYKMEKLAPEAINRPLMESEVRDLFNNSQMRCIKFNVTEVDLYNVFFSKAQLNAIRRDVIDIVWTYVLAFYKRYFEAFGPPVEPKKQPPRYKVEKIKGDFVEIDDLNKLSLVLDKFDNIVYNPANYLMNKAKEFSKAVKKYNKEKLVFLKIPIYVPVDKENLFVDMIEHFDGVFTNNVGGVFLGRRFDKLIVCGPNMNITNTKNWLIKNTNQYMVSPELTYAEIKKFSSPLVYVYGKLPLMYLNYCPRKNIGKECGKCKGDIAYCDKKGEYPITTQKFDGYCEHVLHNAVLTDVGTIEKKFNKYFDFTLSTDEEILTTIDNYYNKSSYRPKDTNKLHFNRGVN